MTEDRDTFAAAIALIGMAVDAKATSSRLAELRTMVEKAEAAAAKLAADRQQHDQKVAADRAALDAREGRQAHYDKLIARWKQQRDFPELDIQPGSSLRREQA